MLRKALPALCVLLSAAGGGWALDGSPTSPSVPLGITSATGDTRTGLLTIRGHELLPGEGGSVVVRLIEQELEVASATEPQIQALLPAGIAPGRYPLQVRAGAGQAWAGEVVVSAEEAAPEDGPAPLRIREAEADLVSLSLVLRGEGFVSTACPTPTVTLADTPLVVLAATEVEIQAQLPSGLAAGGYRVRVLRGPEPLPPTPTGPATVTLMDAFDVAVVAAGGGGGDITAVNTPAGGGLQGGVAAGDANLSLQTCGTSQVLKSDGSAWSCATDADGGVNAVTNGGGITGSITGRTLELGSTATPTSTAGAIVARDGSGSFAAGSLALAGNLALPATSSASAGILSLGGTPFLHAFGANNTFLGSGAGNLSLTGSGNTAIGVGALSGDTEGYSNAAFGYHALLANKEGAANSAFGADALASSVTGFGNAAFGFNALTANTTGNLNAAFGYHALRANTTGTGNTAFGEGALEANTTASNNAAFGSAALFSNTTGALNTAFGASALTANTTGNGNAAFGEGALRSSTAAHSNTAVGASALQAATTGNFNSAFGHAALAANTTGIYNSAFGADALFATTGNSNAAFGTSALQSNATGSSNAAFGIGALSDLSSGNFNIALGYYAGSGLTIGDRNIYIGSAGAASESNAIRIGNTGSGTATYVAGIYGQTSASGVPVFINSIHRLGTLTSSRRYKERIADMGGESDVLMKLRPVSFYYRSELDAEHVRQYGLVAEEVAELAPELVVRDEAGAPQTVRYHFVNAMLLNEVQKQRRELEAQETEIRELKQQLARLEARLPQ